jgi:POTRA domain-containing FtsQ-type protein
MKGFGRAARRAAGARGLQAARRVGGGTTPGRKVITTRGADAALGRATRGLVGTERGGVSVSRAGSASRRRLRGGRIVTPGRAAGLLGMLATGFVFTLVTGPTAFALSRTEIPKLAWTDRDAVLAAMALPDAGNVFGLDTAPLEAAIEALPGVASAEVAVALPDAAVVVRIEERRPVLAWQSSGRRYIADGDGAIFAVLDASDALPEAVAVIDDRRRSDAPSLAIGGYVDAVDLDVATRLGSLTPLDIGSSAVGLQVAVTDSDGFTVSVPNAWVAVFGFYSPATRPAEMIPGQVRLLRSLLEGRESTIRRIVLASETDGTYVPRATPR